MNKEEFKKNLNIEEVVERWSETFDFNNIDYGIKNPRNVAIAMQYCLKYLIYEEEHINDSNVNAHVFPALLRIFRDIEEDLSVDYLVDNSQLILRDIRNAKIKYSPEDVYCFQRIGVQIDAAFLSTFADNYKLPEIN